MPDYQAHVMVCTSRDDPEDTFHCGGKNGSAVRQSFNELLVKHKLIEKVTISNVGCTGQHRLCESSQGTVIVYGPSHELGGTWYVASPEDVEEIITKHLINGRVVERILNTERAVRPS